MQHTVRIRQTPRGQVLQVFVDDTELAAARVQLEATMAEGTVAQIILLGVLVEYETIPDEPMKKRVQ